MAAFVALLASETMFFIPFVRPLTALRAPAAVFVTKLSRPLLAPDIASLLPDVIELTRESFAPVAYFAALL